MNRWIVAILMFDFELVHVPGERHRGLDGLSRRRKSEEDSEDDEELEEEAENWVDEVLGCNIWAAEVGAELQGNGLVLDVVRQGEDDRDVILESEGKEGGVTETPRDKATKLKDLDLIKIRNFLESLKMPEGLTEKARQSFVKHASKFFISGNKLWRKDYSGRHKVVVVDPQEHYHLLIESHDRLGHKGFYSTRRTLGDRFWWPSLDKDIHWFLRTCHQCQIRSTEHVVILPTVQVPASLFCKVYIDTMHMPPSHRHKYIVQARCSLTGWPERHALTHETARTLGAFIFEEILCRWGGLEEIVTNNGTPFVAALDWLSDKYHINHICISAYNS
ncbi:hypothetical protein NP233_g12490 [Leucocoprinus birnbaumii]|uniref:Integrase zinc-binding domain-containing protein n=1 Tax=Leucocoprinus birnbaumii TaxID=56174 RepID=A0AAD5VEE9_9AGAR|nr:hypothetical protein NP233_g12490 [Leucocoprinus birnbaumii]